MSSDYYLGLMSGTSADAIDAVLIDLSCGIELVGHYQAPLSEAVRNEIHLLANPAQNEIDRMGYLDHQLGKEFAAASLHLLEQCHIDPKQVQAIGSHGQTIRHRPHQGLCPGFTLQIANPNIIAYDTGITTVADFRRSDMAAGGQGAPLVPAFHNAIFRSSAIHRIIVNIGGIANVTSLPISGEIAGYDTGPGNSLMDAWINGYNGSAYDAQGAWAASGTTHVDLLEMLLRNRFFRQSAPKSTGRETFNLNWLQQALAIFDNEIPAADVQATLLALTAQTIATEVRNLLGDSAGEVYVCGGGAFNDQMMLALQTNLQPLSVVSTQALGIAPEHVEAMAFAWLAQQTLKRKSGNVKTVTGAKTEVILGGVYYA